jgi:hypothetical protein
METDQLTPKSDVAEKNDANSENAILSIKI